ncbi:penicillin-binding transpeptidase domain-containing protein [Halobacillus litoralis]|uniref:penicillin-binding transpeptidase domain-containing protein n=1 Tax=Halobacillus litoralis TaxID=45668 RepID=UPI00273E4B5E|nr:penicillin-binding transpeptidase domain-containing protein [Halobacillus litoralis]WLR46778.1 penicillin-binding transpeptidase domain-containing protein [Halobacillus litoralis]
MAGVTVTDTQTGAIRAIGGGRNYQKGQFNTATQINRQPGSTFKPITAYGPAIQYNKMSTYHQIKDEKTEFDVNDGWTPNNFDNQFRGWVSARYALSRSLNIPTIKLMEEVGIDKAEEFAKGLGFKVPDKGFMLSDAIGGGVGTNPKEMAAAYAAFGNEGVYNEPHTVTKVEVPGEGTIELTPEPKSAMNSYTAFMISNMLQTTMSEGTGTAANVPGVYLMQVKPERRTAGIMHQTLGSMDTQRTTPFPFGQVTMKKIQCLRRQKIYQNRFISL